MYLGSINVRTSVTVPGLGVKIDIRMFRDVIFRALGIPDCKAFTPYLSNPEALHLVVVDQLSRMIARTLPGVNCSSNPTQAIFNALNIGIGSGGVTIDINTQALTQELLCALVRQVVSLTSVLDNPARWISSALLDLCNSELSSQGSSGVSVNNNYSLQPPPAPPPSPMPPTLPSSQSSAPSIQQNPQNSPGQLVQPKKSLPVPLLVAGGIAGAVSLVILLHKR